MKIQRNIVGLILFVKTCIFSLIFLAYYFFPFNTANYYHNFINHPDESVSLKNAYETWDAQHFLYVSEDGYHIHNDSNAFAPLYPLSIFLGNILIRNTAITGLLISNIASLVAFYLFFLLVTQWFDKKIAYKSLVLLLCFPTSFFFSLIYSESIFFLCIMLFFYFLTKRQLGLASLIALLLPASRLVGIFILFPFVSWYIFELHKLTVYDEVKVIAKKFLRKEAILLASPLVGLGIVMLSMFFLTGNIFEQFDAQKQFISHYSLLSFLNPFSIFGLFFHFPLALHGLTNSLIDRIFFVGLLILIGFMVKRVSPTFLIFSIVFGILPVLSGSFMSYTRYTAIVFPIYIVLAKLSQEKKYNFLEFPLLFIFTVLQTLFIIMHSLNYWVA